MSQNKATLGYTGNLNPVIVALLALALLIAAISTGLKVFPQTAVQEAARPAAEVKVNAPAVNAAAASVRKMDVGGGYFLVYGPEGAAVLPGNPPIVRSQPETASVASFPKTVDIGSGYVLRYDAQGAAVMPEAKAAALNEYTKTMDLGAGYTLKITAEGGAIIPSSTWKAPAAPQKSIDLGAGYVLKLDENGGKIIAPESHFQPSTEGE